LISSEYTNRLSFLSLASLRLFSHNTNKPMSTSFSSTEELAVHIRKLTGWQWVRNPQIVTDTTDWMRINRGDVIRLGDEDFIVKGTLREPRFGIDDQPKPWVINTIKMDTGEKKIVKTVFYEDFNVLIGLFKIHCFRSPGKEADVLKLTHGDDRFMQGYTVEDKAHNKVRILDFVNGTSFFNFIPEIQKNHETYYYEDLGTYLWKLLDSLEAIKLLHHYDFCHGDIRNDHIIIDSTSGKCRWIDFDLSQNVTDFDIWSFGNIICYAVAKGILTFKSVLKSTIFSDEIKSTLSSDDASAFYEYRIMNVKKVYPYISDKLSKILNHFTLRPKLYYTNINELHEDFVEMLETEFPKP